MSSQQQSAPVNQPLRPLRPRVTAAAGAATPAWPSYTGTSQLVGTSSLGVTVYVDPSLGDRRFRTRTTCSPPPIRSCRQNNAIFGITGGAVDVIVFALGGQTDGTGGADHDGCDFTR